MTSILTNSSAMVALQTLRTVNKDLTSISSQVSTGRKINSSADNAALFAVTSVMQADVAGFNAISESLALGKASVSVARNASEKVTELLRDVKEKVVAAQEDNVDRTKIQTDIDELRNQITSIVSAAQFNGLNLIDGSVTTTNTNTNTGVDILSSLNRASDGTVTTGSIGVDSQNLSQVAGLSLAAAAASVGTDPGVAGTLEANDGGTNDSIELDTFAFLDTAGGATGTSASTAKTAGVDDTLNTGVLAGDQMSLTIGTVKGTYVVKEGDNEASIAAGVKNALIAAGLNTDDFTLDVTTAAGELIITNETNEDVTFAFEASRGTGGLADLLTLDVSTAANAATALTDIENLIQTAVDASAAFGSSEKRVGIQQDFVQSLVDSFEAGIGALVDADMEKASARLQALQVQQQLATQALSIANSSPQSILSLFR
ncbi:MAG: flagellin [Rhodobacteraceae bacterium]|nr:flagellin [Paracoccaceae bacterium]